MAGLRTTAWPDSLQNSEPDAAIFIPTPDGAGHMACGISDDSHANVTVFVTRTALRVTDERDNCFYIMPVLSLDRVP